MSEAKKMKYLSKTVSFGGKSFTLFSLDGLTWSSRKQELIEIKERQEMQKVSFAAIKEENGETRVVAKTKAKVDDEEIIDPIIEGEELPPQIDYAIPEEKAPRGKKGKGRPALQAAPAAKPSKLKKEAKKIQKISPKKRASGKPKAKPAKAKNKKKKAA